MGENRKERLAEFLYIIAFLTIIAVDYISITNISLLISGRMIQFALLLLGIKVILTSYSLKEWVLIILAGIISALSYLSVGNYFVCELFLLIIAAKKVNIKRLLKLYIVLIAFLTIMVGFAATFANFGEVYQLKKFRGELVEKRYCMGYNHPNSYHIIMLQLMLITVYVYWEKIKCSHIFLMMASNLILAFFTDSRTNAILGTVIFILAFWGKKYSAITKNKCIYLINFMVAISCIILSGFTILTGTKSKLLSLINRLWTERIRYAHDAAERSKITLFSSKELQISCDMGFVEELYNYGIIIFILLLFIIFYKMVQNYKERNYAENLCIMAGIIFFLGEKFSSGEFITRNILFLVILSSWKPINKIGWYKNEANKSEESSN